MKTQSFVVRVPVVPGVSKTRMRRYIRVAVECWQGQYNPDEDPLFGAFKERGPRMVKVTPVKD